jgi:hypothetical protein
LGDRRLALSVGSIAEAGENVFVGQIRLIRDDLFLGHSRSKIGEYVIHGDPKTTDARLSAALIRLDRDDVVVIHPAELYQS